MNILSFDSSVNNVSVCLKLGKKDKIYLSKSGKTNSLNFAATDTSAVLMPLVVELIDSQNLTLKDFDILAVGVGPGSFTGVRTGVVTARALALASFKPLMGINTFEAISSIYQKKIAIVLNAYKNFVFIAVYDKFKPVLNPVCVNYSEILEYLEPNLKTCDLLVLDNTLSLDLNLPLSTQYLDLNSINLASCQIDVICNNLNCLELGDLNLKFSYTKIQPLYLKEASVTMKKT